MEFLENTIAQVTVLPREGEKWLKNTLVKHQDCNLFLKEEFQEVDWSKGIPREGLKDE
jgi:hypothetical protein